MQTEDFISGLLLDYEDRRCRSDSSDPYSREELVEMMDRYNMRVPPKASNKDLCDRLRKKFDVALKKRSRSVTVPQISSQIESMMLPPMIDDIPKECVVCAEPIENIQNFFERFRKGEVLGKGTYGIVYEAIDNRTGEKVVVKESLNKEMNEIAPDYVREVSALQALRGNPDIVEMKGMSLSAEEARIILEAAAGSLDKDFRKRPQIYGDSMTTKKALFQIIRGMKAMNDLGMLHRDLKPQNVLVMPDGNYKITDFGLTRGGPFQWLQKSGAVWTIWYRPPEVLQQRVFQKRDVYEYDVAGDVWSIGVIMWDMLAAAKNDYDAVYRLRTTLPDTSTDEANQEDQLWKFMWSLGGDSFNYTFCKGGHTEISKADCKAFFQKKMTNPDQNHIDPFHRSVEQARKSTLRQIGIDMQSETADLLFKLLDPNPDTRISLAAALGHPYFDEVRLQIQNERPVPPFPITQNMIERTLPNSSCPESMFAPDSEMNSSRYEILVDWLYDVMLHYRFSPATYFLALHILKCYTSRVPVKAAGMIQAVGVCALYLAALYVELWAVPIDDMVYISNNQYDVLTLAEIARDMLAEVGGQMHLSTSFVFLVEKLKDRPELKNQPRKFFSSARFTPGLILVALEMMNSGKTFNLGPYALAMLAARIYDHPNESDLKMFEDYRWSTKRPDAVAVINQHLELMFPSTTTKKVRIESV